MAIDITGIGSVADLVNTAIGKIWPVYGSGWAGRAATNLRYAAKDN